MVNARSRQENDTAAVQHLFTLFGRGGGVISVVDRRMGISYGTPLVPHEVYKSGRIKSTADDALIV